MGAAVVPIAKNTFKEAVRQPVFWILIFMSLLLIWVTANLPLWTITGNQDDEKLAKDIGLAALTMCALLVALFACSSVISAELDSKTALTVLSKPVTRGQFVVGKYLGIALLVLLACAIVGAVLIAFICWYKVGPREGEYLDHPDEGVRSAVMERIRRDRMIVAQTITQGTVLSYLQVMLLSAVAVAISTRVGMVINMTVCIFLFVIGHMADWTRSLIEHAFDGGRITEGGSRILVVIWKVVYAILPNLDNTQAQMTLAQGRLLSGGYLGWALVHSVLYIVAALLFGTWLLRRREIS